MQERLKALLNRIVEWWKALTIRMRTMIVCVSAVIVLAFVVLVSLLSKPQYTLLKECETAKEASQIADLLEGEGYTYQVSDDGLRVDILTSELGKANLLLGANNIVSAPYTIDMVTDGGMGVTESDKQKRYIELMESKLEHDFLGMFDAIKTAQVMLHLPENNGTLIATEEEASAAITLEIDGDFTEDNAAFLAKAVATALGNDSTEKITIMDSMGNMLFAGGDNYAITGSANSQLAVRQQSEMVVGEKVKRALEGTNGFDEVEVAVNLDIDFSTKQITDHDYESDENSTQGLLAEAHIYNSDSTAGQGDVPGTDSNDEGTTYVLDDYGEQSTTVTEEDYKYVPNEQVTQTSVPAGTINYDASSAAVTAIDYIVIREEDAKNQGLLEGITWEEYKAQNDGRVRMEVDNDLIEVVAMATGIASENIRIVAYQENWFMDKEGLSMEPMDIVALVLIILIIALLAFVILRSMMREKQSAEEEEELSVESLLQSTPESELEDIEVESKSEIRMMIEKFVEDNPESAANLLRNWLNEDWE